jgi:hypothetical protein
MAKWQANWLPWLTQEASECCKNDEAMTQETAD